MSRTRGAGGRGHQPNSSTGGSLNGWKAELTSAYASLAAELTRKEVKVVGGYTLGRVIGEGSFGKVRIGVHRLTNTRVAIKQVPKSLSFSGTDRCSPLSLLTREIHHHRRLRHPHLLALYEIIATESSIHLVTELCTGGELFDYLVEKGRLSEKETRRIFGQAVLGVAHLHAMGVVHRDLKLENILLDERVNVKIADLGFGREFEKGRWMETWVGTLGYCAPEVVAAKKYLGEAVDIWSLGVILFTLLTGSLPFDDDDESIMKEKILRCEYDIPVWLDEDAADLIRRILQLDPNRRLSLDAILSHVFFTAPRSHSQPSFYSHDIKVASSHIGFDDFPPPIPEEGDRLDSPTEETSAFATTFPIVDSDRMTQSSLFVGIEHTTPHHDPSDSGTTKSSPAFLSVAAPFLRRNVSSGSSSSINSAGSPIPVHSRTPSRTKRRSVGSMMSERLFSLDEEPGTTIVDYHGLLAVPTPEPLATESDRKLLDSLTTLGFDTGQMVHSVMTNACDSSGAVWWMLKSKADDRNRAIREAERSAVSEGQGLGVNGIDAMMASSEVSLIDPRPDRPLVSVSPVPGTLQLDFSLGSNPFSLQAPSSPQLLDLSAVQPPPLSISSVFSNECLTPPLTATSRLPSPASTPTTIRILDDLHLTPTKSRSNSINLLSRATAAIGNSLALKKSNDAVREGGGRGTEEGGGGKSPGSGTTLPLARLFQRKLSDPNSIMTAGIDTFEGSSPTSTRSNPLPVSPPRRPLLAISPHTSPARESSSLSHSTNDSINTASSPASSFATSASSERSFGPKSKGSKRNLFTNFRMWFGDDRRRKRNSVPNMGVNDSTSRGTGVGGAGGGGGGRRNQNGPHSYASSPLKRPPLGSRRSSHGGVVPSRQSSRASVHLIPPATVIGATELSRRRSDGSRASMSDREAGLGLAPAPTTTTTSSRPLSVRSFSGNDFLPTTLRRPLRTAGSSSSIGSGRSCSGTHGGAYRRTPTTTTVRRIHVAGRHPSRSRSATSASSICMTRQSSSSSITGNNNARMVEELESRILTSMLMVGEDNPEESILEEDELEEDERVDDVELQRMIEERQKTLRRLSQTVVEELPKAISLSIGSTGRSTPSHHHHHHSVSATTTTVFTAHKTHHLFGAPSQYVSTPSAAVTAPSKSHPHHHARHHASSSRPVLRDVFAAKDSEGEWIDEDKERDYGGGLGQLGSSSSRSSFLAVALPTAAVTMTNARGGASHDSPVPAVAMGFGGRYAESIAIETTALESFSVGSGRRGSGTANGGGNNITTLRSAPVIEEEEEEEED